MPHRLVNAGEETAEVMYIMSPPKLLMMRPTTSSCAVSPSVSTRSPQSTRLDLGVRHGEFLSLLGPSGCGKTTTLRLIAGFERPDEGEVRIGGEDVARLPPYKRDVNTVFQSYALFPHLSVLDNVAYGLKQRGIDKGERQARARELLELVHLEQVGGAEATAALGRPAAARRARAGAGEGPDGPAARRAAGRARPEAAQGAAGRA